MLLPDLDDLGTIEPVFEDSLTGERFLHRAMGGVYCIRGGEHGVDVAIDITSDIDPRPFVLQDKIVVRYGLHHRRQRQGFLRLQYSGARLVAVCHRMRSHQMLRPRSQAVLLPPLRMRQQDAPRPRGIYHGMIPQELLCLIDQAWSARFASSTGSESLALGRCFFTLSNTAPAFNSGGSGVFWF